MKRRLILLTVLVLIIGSINAYAATDINEVKSKLKNTNDEIKKIERELKENSNNQKKVSSEIKLLDLKVDKAQKELSVVENDLITVQNNIVKTKNELLEAENNISQKNEVFKSRIRAMYINGNMGYIEVLLGSQDFGDFLSRLDMIQYIIKQDKELLGYMKEQKNIIEEKKKELDIQAMNLTTAKLEVEKKKSNLVLASREKQKIIDKLKKDEKAMEHQYDSMEKQAKELEEVIRKQLIAGKYSGGRMLWPVPAYHKVTSPYGMRFHPVYKKMKFHSGVDLRAYYGTDIVAANDGIVQFAGWLGTYGKAVIIDHGGKIATLYAHNSKILVKAGQKVLKGDVISKSGSTGASTAAHLHFEVRKNGSRLDPLPWITSQ